MRQPVSIVKVVPMPPSKKPISLPACVSRLLRRDEAAPFQQVSTVAVLGDQLACLAQLRDTAGVRLFRNLHTTMGRYRSVVVGVDIAGLMTIRRIADRIDDAFREVAVTTVVASDCDDPALLAA